MDGRSARPRWETPLGGICAAVGVRDDRAGTCGSPGFRSNFSAEVNFSAKSCDSFVNGVVVAAGRMSLWGARRQPGRSPRGAR